MTPGLWSSGPLEYWCSVPQRRRAGGFQPHRHQARRLNPIVIRQGVKEHEYGSRNHQDRQASEAQAPRTCPWGAFFWHPRRQGCQATRRLRRSDPQKVSRLTGGHVLGNGPEGIGARGRRLNDVGTSEGAAGVREQGREQRCDPSFICLVDVVERPAKLGSLRGDQREFARKQGRESLRLEFPVYGSRDGAFFTTTNPNNAWACRLVKLDAEDSHLLRKEPCVLASMMSDGLP